LDVQVLERNFNQFNDLLLQVTNLLVTCDFEDKETVKQLGEVATTLEYASKETCNLNSVQHTSFELSAYNQLFSHLRKLSNTKIETKETNIDVLSSISEFKNKLISAMNNSDSNELKRHCENCINRIRLSQSKVENAQKDMQGLSGDLQNQNEPQMSSASFDVFKSGISKNINDIKSLVTFDLSKDFQVGIEELDNKEISTAKLEKLFEELKDIQNEPNISAKKVIDNIDEQIKESNNILNQISNRKFSNLENAVKGYDQTLKAYQNVENLQDIRKNVSTFETKGKKIASPVQTSTIALDNMSYTVVDMIEQSNANFNKTLRAGASQESILSANDIAKHFISQIQPTGMNIDDILHAETETARNDKINKFKVSLYTRQNITKRQGQISGLTNTKTIGNLTRSISHSVGLDARNVLDRTIPNKLSNFFKVDKSSLDLKQKEIQQQINNTLQVLNAMQILNLDKDDIEQVKKLNEELVQRNNEINDLKNGENILTMASKIGGFLGGGKSFLLSIFGVMGLSNMLSLGGLFKDSVSKAVSNDMLMYQAARTDISLGADIASNANLSRIYNTGRYYQYLSGAMIGADAPTKFYMSLARNIGGRYNSTPEANRSDMSFFAENLFSLKETSGLDNNDFDFLIKYFYKDSGQDAKTTATIIANMVEQAKSSGMSTKMFFENIKSMVTRARELGIDAEKATDVIASATQSGMNMTDAVNLMIKTSQIELNFGKNTSQSMYWGMMSGWGGGMYSAMLRGRIFMDRNGNQVGDWKENMGNAMLAKYTMFDNFLGGNNSLSLYNFQNLLKQDGYSEKEIAQLTAMKQEGKTDEIKEFLVGKKERDEKKKIDLADSISDADKELAIMASQLAKTQLMVAEREDALMRLAYIWQTKINPLLEGAVKQINELLEKLPEWAGKIAHWLNELANNKTVQNITRTIGNNPILGLGTTLFALGAGYQGIKYMGKGAMNQVKNLVTKSRPTGGGKGWTGLALAGASAATLYWLNKRGEAEENVDEGTPSMQDNHTGFIQFMKSGRAKVQIANYDEIMHSMEGNEDESDFMNYAINLGLGAGAIYMASPYIGNVLAPLSAAGGGVRHALWMSLKRGDLRHFRKLPNKLMSQLARASEMEGKVPVEIVNQLKRTFNSSLSDIRLNSWDDIRKFGGALKTGTGNQIISSLRNTKNAFSTNWSALRNLDPSMMKSIASGARNLGREYWMLSALGETIGEFGDAMSGNQRSWKERLARVAIGTGTSVAGGAIGGAIGQVLIPIPGVGFVLGSMVGGWLGGKGGDAIKDYLGMGEKFDEATADWVACMNENSEIRGIDIMKVIESETDQGEFLRTYLKDNGIDLSKLNDTQKKILKEMVKQLQDQNVTLKQLMQALAINRRAINQNTAVLDSKMSDNNILGKFFETYANNYEDDDELNILYTHLANYYYHPNAGSTDKQYWENEAAYLRELAGKDTPFAQRIKRNVLEWAKKKNPKYASNPDMTDDDIINFELKNMTAGGATELWQHIAGVVKNEPSVNSDLMNYVNQNYNNRQQIGLENSSSLDRSIMLHNHDWEDELTKWSTLRPESIAGMNALARAYKDAHGGELIEMTGGAETFVHAGGEYSHHTGWKTDVVSDDMEWIIQWCHANGYAAIIEDEGTGNVHVDINWSGNDNRPEARPTGGRQPLTRTDGTVANPLMSGLGGYVGNYDVTVDSGITAAELEPHLQGVLKGKAQFIIDTARKYGIDPAFFAAITYAENGFGGDTSGILGNGEPYNVYSLMDDHVDSSVEENITRAAVLLKEDYIDEGIKTIGAIQRKYCPAGAANDQNGTNVGWLDAIGTGLRALGVNVSAQAGSGKLQFKPPKPMTAIEQFNNNVSIYNSISKYLGKTPTYGGLSNNMNVVSGSNYVSADEKRKQIREQYRSGTRSTEEMNAVIESQKSILEQQQKLDAQKASLQAQQDAIRKAEKENVGTVQIFGIMKDGKDAEEMMKKIEEAMNQSEFAKRVNTSIIENEDESGSEKIQLEF